LEPLGTVLAVMRVAVEGVGVVMEGVGVGVVVGVTAGDGVTADRLRVVLVVSLVVLAEVLLAGDDGVALPEAGAVAEPRLAVVLAVAVAAVVGAVDAVRDAVALPS